MNESKTAHDRLSVTRYDKDDDDPLEGRRRDRDAIRILLSSASASDNANFSNGSESG